MQEDLLTRADRERTEILNAYKYLIKDCHAFTTKDERKMLRDAFMFSLECHKDARRKSGEPYILHPIAVARILVREMGVLDVTSVICALLHDVVEDTFAEVDDLRVAFGPKVATIVDGLTKISGVMDPSRSKQADNFRKMLLTMSDDIRVALVKIADRLHNMRTLTHQKRESQLRISAETQFIYAPLAHRLGLYAIKSELEDLSFSYAEPEIYQEIVLKMRATKTVRDKYIQNFIRPLRERLAAAGMNCRINGRVKSISSIYSKMKVQNIPFEQVYDLFAIRIILDVPEEIEKETCWKAYSTVTSLYKPHPERMRDWISTPRPNGYESLHTTVMGPRGTWVEVQIRSERMDAAAEMGVAAHWKYKDKASSAKADKEAQLENWLAKIRALLENQQLSAFDFVNELNNSLISEEIFIFTPKGDMRTLPAGASVLDFAFDIHTNIGLHCIGAKVNQMLVPLNHKLQNADQVEIITSKVQKPEPDWLNFVITNKAITKISESVKDQRRVVMAKGEKIFKWKARQLDVTEEHEAISDLLRELKVPNLSEFYYRLGSHRIDLKKVVEFIRIRSKQISGQEAKLALQAQTADKRPEVPLEVEIAATVAAAQGFRKASCCNPIPGDEIIGFRELNGTVVIHRANCPRIIELMTSFGQRVIKAKWNVHEEIEYLANIGIRGLDKLGVLNKIVRVISLNLKLNIRGLTIDSNAGVFDGIFQIYVHNTEDVDNIIAKLLDVSDVLHAERLDR